MAVPVGEEEAHRHGLEILDQMVQDRPGGPQETVIGVRLGLEWNSNRSG
jgi:hypothetical protein